MDSQYTRGRRLDASGPRQVVYCHNCRNEWYKDEHEQPDGHEQVCPDCGSQIVEEIDPNVEDPRGFAPPFPTIPRDHLDDHNPWEAPDSDPDEADIEEHIRQGAHGETIFTRTTRSSPRTFTTTRTARAASGPEVMLDFQNLIGSLMGPGYRPGPAGRSGPDTLFNDGFPPLPGNTMHGTFAIPPGPRGPGGPNLVGGRVTFTTTRGGPGGFPPRGPGGPGFARVGSPRPGEPDLPIDIATIIGNILGQPQGQPGPNQSPMAGLPGLFAAMLNPANARSGDAVYSQEALDQIVSQLMEQSPSSNAPGPATADAIASLPKKKADEKILGPEGKAECSICMDVVITGDEVVVLPCTHWFHEACAGAWLSEHNTCPICRKGIEPTPEATPAASTSPFNARRTSTSGFPSRNEARTSRLNRFGSPNSQGRSEREARLNYIRSNAGVPVSDESMPSRWAPSSSSAPPSPQEQGDYPDRFTPLPIPGAFSPVPSPVSSRRQSDREGRGGTSGSDRSRRSSQSGGGNGNGGGGGGPLGWLRNRLGSNRRTDESH